MTSNKIRSIIRHELRHNGNVAIPTNHPDNCLTKEDKKLFNEIKKEDKQLSELYYRKSLSLLPEKRKKVSEIMLLINYILKPIGIRGLWRVYEIFF